MCDIRCSVEGAFCNVDYILGCKMINACMQLQMFAEQIFLNAPCVRMFAILCSQSPCLQIVRMTHFVHKVSALEDSDGIE